MVTFDFVLLLHEPQSRHIMASMIDFNYNMTQGTNTVVHLGKTRQFLFPGAGNITHNLCGAVDSSISTLSH